MLATSAKFQLNISKIVPARPKKQREVGGEYCYNLIFKNILLEDSIVCT